MLTSEDYSLCFPDILITFLHPSETGLQDEGVGAVPEKLVYVSLAMSWELDGLKEAGSM